jgi:hypothetical protein
MYSKSLTHRVKASECLHILLTMLKYGGIYFELYVPQCEHEIHITNTCTITMYHNIPHYNVLSSTNPVYLTTDQSA